MKTIKLFTLTLGLFFCFGAQAMHKKTDNQTRNVDSFDAIKVSSGIDLYLTQGNMEKVIIKADPDIIDQIVTEVKDGVLNIYLEKNMNWKWTKSRKAYVTFDDLIGIKVSAGSDVYSENGFKLNKLKLDVSSGSDIKLEDLDVRSIWLETSSGSDAQLSGNVDHFEAKSSSGSDIDARNLVSKTCKVKVSSGSDAIVYATERIDANASSGGDVRYRGNPKHKNVNESSGGDVSSF